MDWTFALTALSLVALAVPVAIIAHLATMHVYYAWHARRARRRIAKRNREEDETRKPEPPSVRADRFAEEFERRINERLLYEAEQREAARRRKRVRELLAEGAQVHNGWIWDGEQQRCVRLEA